MTLFERVKKVSKDKGFSLAEVARKAGIGEKSIYTWKPSKTYPNGVTPSHDVLEKVANVLGISVDTLLGDTLVTDDTTKKNPKVKRLARRMDSMDDEDLDFVNQLLDRIERSKNGKS